MKKEDLGGLMILLSVIAVVAAFFIFAPNAPKIAYEPVEETGSALSVTDPDLDHLNTVTVNATLKVAGFITFHEAIGEAPGPVVGQSVYLEPGEYQNLQINLSAPLQADDQFFALMFKDDGDHVYEPGVDLPVKSDGQVIKVHFITPSL